MKAPATQKSLESGMAWLLMAPMLILLALFVLWPILHALHLSLYETDGLGHKLFVGARNFRLLLAADPAVRKSLVNLAAFAVLTVPLQTFGPLVGAKLLHMVGNNRLAYWYRSLLVLPILVPTVVNLLIWQSIYSSDGALNRILQALQLEGYIRGWIGDPQTVIPAIVFTGMPWTGGISVLLYLAGLHSISQSVYEAAELDGAGPWRTFTRIEFPLLLPQIHVIAILSVIGVVQNFENVLILTNGGPVNASLTPALYMFKSAFEFGQVGYASAIGVLLLFFTVALALLARSLQK